MKEKFAQMKNKTIKFVKDHKDDILVYSGIVVGSVLVGYFGSKKIFEEGEAYGEQFAIDRTNELLREGILIWGDGAPVYNHEGELVSGSPDYFKDHGLTKQIKYLSKL